jgi:hypothetical protein
MKAEALIARLDLRPHPEGGHYREVFRSDRRVLAAAGRERAAVTTIYFLLVRGEASRWHRLDHDEVWHHLEGAPLQLLWLAPDLSRVERRTLGPVSGTQEPAAVVPAGCWQAAHSTGDHSLAACTMGPGFEFGDFALMASQPTEAEILRQCFPELEEYL